VNGGNKILETESGIRERSHALADLAHAVNHLFANLLLALRPSAFRPPRVETFLLTALQLVRPVRLALYQNLEVVMFGFDMHTYNAY
jgi:hypothetical protein